MRWEHEPAPCALLTEGKARIDHHANDRDGRHVGPLVPLRPGDPAHRDGPDLHRARHAEAVRLSASEQPHAARVLAVLDWRRAGDGGWLPDPHWPLLTRPAAFLLAGEMAVAYWIVHAPRNLFPALNGGDAAILYCFIFLFLVFAGPGALSVDGAQREQSRSWLPGR